MKTEDIRLINENQGTGRVFFHTFDNKTICRIMTMGEVKQGQLIRKSEGEEAFKQYFVTLFNEKYTAPQSFSKPSARDARFFELIHYAKTGVISPEQEQELREEYNISAEELADE